MFKQVLYAQWLSARHVVMLFVVLCFAVPLFTVYYGANLAQAAAGQVAYWLLAAEKFGLVLPVFAALLGLLIGYSAWSADHAGKHVYALSLPILRPTFVVLRFAAGAVLLAPPVIALGLGSFIAVAVVKLPTGIHGYPVQLTVRFAMAALATFSIFFALSIGTRRGLLAVLSVIAGLLLTDLILSTVDANFSVTEQTFYLFTNWPGPLSILIGRWALFDV